MAVVQELHFRGDVVDAIKHVSRFLPLPRAQEIICRGTPKELVPTIEIDPWSDLFQAFANAVHLRRTHVCQRREGVSVQRRERNLVEIDKPDLGYARASERGCRMRSDAATSDDNYER